MLRKWIVALLFLATPTFVFAGKLEVGKPLPEVAVEDNGQIYFKTKDQLAYKPWSSKEVTGKVRSIYHLAASLSASKINEAYTDELDKLKLPVDKFQTLTILNLDDAMLGTGPFVRSESEKNQRKYATTWFLLDADGKVRDAWGLTPDSSAVILVDQEGKVLMFKDGKLSPEEIKQFLETIKMKMTP